MKRYLLPALLVALVPAAGWLMRPAAAAPALKDGPVKWEYKAVPRRALMDLGQKTDNDGADGQQTAGLNALGAEGWELVAVDTRERSGNHVFLFRRPK